MKTLCIETVTLRDGSRIDVVRDVELLRQFMDERQKLIDRLEEAMAHISSVQHCLEGGCYSLADHYAADAWREVRAVRLAMREEQT